MKFMRMAGLRAVGALLLTLVLMGCPPPQDAFIEIEAGTGTGDIGDIVTIPLTLVNHGVQPSSIELTVIYDASILELISEGVETGTSIVTAGAFDQFELTPGSITMEIWSFANPLADGVLFNLNFQVISQNTGSSEIQLSEVSAATIYALEIPASSVDGSITINSGNSK